MKSKQDAYFEDKLLAQDAGIDEQLQASDYEGEEDEGMSYYDAIGNGIDLNNIKNEQDVVSASQKLAQNYADTQAQLQNESAQLTVNTLEQEKQDLEKEYHKEQSAAYKDYQKAIDPYGVQAEQLAASGLSNSGYSESAKMQAYVAYQNRVTAMKESYTKAVVSYNNSIAEAKALNNSSLAQIAYQNLQTQLELILSNFQSGQITGETQAETTTQDTFWGTPTNTTQVATNTAIAEETPTDATEWELLGAGLNTIGTGLKNWSDASMKGVNLYKRFSPSGRLQTLIQSAKDVKLDSPESIKKFLRANMISAPDAMTRKDWMREKQNGNTEPQYQFDSYAQYLGTYLLACLENSVNPNS